MIAQTHHASRRCAQRGIGQEALDLLWEFAAAHRSHGADRLCFDARSRRRIRRALGGDWMRRNERLLDAFAVIADDGAVITAGWRTRRLHRS